MVVVVVVIECFFVPFCSLHTLTLLCDETFLCSCRLLFSPPYFFGKTLETVRTLSFSRVLALFYYYWILGMVVVVLVVVRTFTHYYTSFLQVLVRFAATAFAAAAAAATPTTTSTASTTSNALSFFLPHSHASSSCIRLPFRPLSSVTEQSPRR